MIPANIVNADDFIAIFRQLRRRPAWVARRFLPGRRRRVVDSWSRTNVPPVHWYDIQEVRNRRGALATGDPDRSIRNYIADRHLGNNLRGISLGCGSGYKEAAWAGTNRFEKLQCFDVSASRIGEARARWENPVLQFDVGDAYQLQFPTASLDVVIFEDALHHLEPVETILERCRKWLRPGGHLIVNDYVGARRFQWSPRQLEAADAMLGLLPEHLRISHAHNNVKRSNPRPSLLRMRLLDPSEAVESDLILPAVRHYFDVVEERPLGGTLVNLVLDDIAQNFLEGETEWLQMMFAIEDQLIACGELESDYALIIAQPR